MHRETTERRRSFIINIMFFAVVLGIIYVLVKYVAAWLMPFIIGYGIAYLLKPIVNVAAKRIKISRRIIACVVVLLAYFGVGSLLYLIGSRIGSSIVGFIANLPQMYEESLVPAINQVNLFFTQMFERLSPEWVERISMITTEMLQWLKDLVVSISTSFLSWAGEMTKGLPNFFTAFIFAIMSSIFIAMDFGKITSFLLRQLPAKYREYVYDFKGYLVNTAFRYFRAILILMSITFLELSVGLLILRVDNPVGIAALIAILDALPVLGTGGIMIPWIVVEIIQGHYSLAIGLSITYGIITLVRNFLEPKIVGQQLGLHPMVTLVAMYVGLKVLGLKGMIIMPIVAIILMNFQKEGKIRLWKD